MTLCKSTLLDPRFALAYLMPVENITQADSDLKPLDIGRVKQSIVNEVVAQERRELEKCLPVSIFHFPNENYTSNFNANFKNINI